MTAALRDGIGSAWDRELGGRRSPGQLSCRPPRDGAGGCTNYVAPPDSMLFFFFFFF